MGPRLVRACERLNLSNSISDAQKRSALLLLVLLHDESLVDVRDDTTAGDGRLDQRVELLVTSDGEKEMSRGDSLDLEVLRGVTSELKNLGGEVLEDGGRVDGRGGANSAVGTDAGLEESVDSSHGELEQVSGYFNRQVQRLALRPTQQGVSHHRALTASPEEGVNGAIQRLRGQLDLEAL